LLPCRVALMLCLVDRGGNAGKSFEAPCRPLPAGAVRLGSCFHQFRPISSALSTEQISRRILMVKSSTFAKAMLISPAMTSPLSRTRSKMSIRFVLPEIAGTRSIVSFSGDDSTIRSLPRKSSNGAKTQSNKVYALTHTRLPTQTLSNKLDRTRTGGGMACKFRFSLRSQGCIQRLTSGTWRGCWLRDLTLTGAGQRSQLQAQIFGLESELRSYLVDLLFQLHQRLTHIFNLLVGERAAF